MEENDSGDRRQRFGGHGSRFGGQRPRFGGQGPREMHKAKCAECGEECEVPFKPTEGKPVYCRACFAKRKPRY